MAHSKTAPPPLVSVGMPIYNGAATVRRALDALLAQDYQHFELIVSDNASTDDTWDILSAYAARDTRVRLFRNEQNQGALDNFHRVFELAQGEYFMWAAHDDWWEPSFISTCLGLLVAQPQAALCYPHSRFYYSQEERCENRRVDALQGDHPEAWQRLYSFMKIEPLPAVLTYGLCRRENLRRVLPLGNYNGSDNVMLMRLLITGTFVKADAYLFNYTVKKTNPRRRMKQMNLNPAAYLVWGFANIPPIVAAINRAAPDFRVRLRLYLRLLKMYLYSNGQITALTILFNALYAMLPDRWADRLHAR